MTPFLQQVAEAYIKAERNEMADYCFVFTNKRAATFFEHYLAGMCGELPLIMPHTTTISDMMRSLTDLTPVSRLDAIFVLYHKYKELMTPAPEDDGEWRDDNERLDFDRFLFWGEMLLADFNDVDRYLVDPERLFVNLKRVREIATDFLTDEQKEVLGRYWGETFQPVSPERFWEHVNPREDAPDAPPGKFVKLWEVLLPLYRSFQETLLADGLATEGMIVRRAVEHLKKARAADLPYRRYIFVGFNVITVSEFVVMQRLMALDAADFYWDFGSAAFEMPGNRASRFMRRNIRNFPSRYDIEAAKAAPADSFPEIVVTGVPSGVGQAKVAGRTLARWVEEKAVADPDNAIDTAVVLPDESLFMPTIHAVPAEITALNVTMGFPLRTTPFASFMDTLLRMHTEAALSSGEWQYFYRDVNALLSHPLTTRIDREGCSKMLTAIVSGRLYMVSASLLKEQLPRLAFLFEPIRVEKKHRMADEIYAFLHTMILALHDALVELAPKADDEAAAETAEAAEEDTAPDGSLETDFDDADGRALAEGIDIAYARAWLAALEELKSAIDRRGISMGEATFMRMLNRAVGSASINFAGMPLSGLQVMGVLETRSLDFDNIIILSMNERVFPQRIFTRSFIPDTLRRAYGMATTDHQESIFAYYFYRLIGRARRVTLLYDVRDAGIGSSEVSRYVAQLLYLFPGCRITHDTAVFPSLPAQPEGIVIDKHADPAIIPQLRSYVTPGGRTLSVSAIKTFLHCPLSFYLKYVGNIFLDNSTMDHMDSATFGSIFHSVAEMLYKSASPSGGAALITPELLNAWTADSASIARHIEPFITSAVNDHFNHLSDNLDRPLSGEARAMGNVVRELIVKMLKAEMPLTPIEFVKGEYELKGTLSLPTRTLNIFQIIDRIDRIASPDGSGMTLRFVDYKTGSDATRAGDVSTWFSSGTLPAALVQLMFYCCAYAEKTGYSGPIMPQVYNLLEIAADGIKPCVVDKQPLTDYRPHREVFLQALSDALDPLFDENVPFSQTPNPQDCKYCEFRNICRR